MKKSKITIVATFVVAFLLAFVSYETKAQETQKKNTIKLSSIELTPFVGFATTTQTPLGEFNVTEFYDFRVGVKTKTKFTKTLSLKLEAGAIIGTTTGFSTASLYFEKNNFWIEVGKTASTITRFRPSPISANSQVEFVSTTTIPGQPKVAALVGYKKEGRSLSENAGVEFCMAERGKFLGDSLEFSTKLTYGYFSLGAYENAGEMGLLFEFKSKSCSVFFSFKEEQYAGYAYFTLKNGWGSSIDWVYNHGESGKLTQEKDFGELIIFKQINYPLFKNFSGSCFLGVGFRNDATANIYLQIALD